MQAPRKCPAESKGTDNGLDALTSLRPLSEGRRAVSCGRWSLSEGTLACSGDNLKRRRSGLTATRASSARADGQTGWFSAASLPDGAARDDSSVHAAVGGEDPPCKCHLSLLMARRACRRKGGCQSRRALQIDDGCWPSRVKSSTRPPQIGCRAGRPAASLLTGPGARLEWGARPAASLHAPENAQFPLPATLSPSAECPNLSALTRCDEVDTTCWGHRCAAMTYSLPRHPSPSASSASTPAGAGHTV